MLAIYVLLFNVILDKGIIPESWTEGIMIPIYKNKGSKLDPASYRGITLNSCLSKTFKVIYNMYQNIKTCIRKGEECSVFFNSEVGVKQGENMSLFCSHCF